MARRTRFVAPDAVKIDLTDGDWIKVKKQLNLRETKSLETVAMTHMKQENAADQTGVISLDFARYHIERILTWLVGWSFEGADGERVPFSRESIENLDMATFDEITRALDAHVKGVLGKETTQTGGDPSLSNSSSVGTTDGAGSITN